MFKWLYLFYGQYNQNNQNIKDLLTKYKIIYYYEWT